MENVKRWRISTSITAFVSICSETVYTEDRIITKDSVYLVDLDDKQTMSRLKKMRNLTEIHIDNTEFKVSLGTSNRTDINIWIQSDELPKPNTWYFLENFHKSHLTRLLLKNTIEQGVFIEKFTPVVSPSADLAGQVSLVSERMTEDFEVYTDEMMRYILSTTEKKTKKIRPGYKYYSPNETIIPLKKTNIWDAGGEIGETCWLYVECIGNFKTISEVLNNCGIFNSESCPISIKLNIGQFSSMVESEKVLEDDTEQLSIEDFIDKLVLNTKVEFNHTWQLMTNTPGISAALSLLNDPTKSATVASNISLKNKMLDLLQKATFQYVREYINYYDISIGSEIQEEVIVPKIDYNIESLFSWVPKKGIFDNDKDRLKNLLNYRLNIDLKEIITSEIRKYNIKEILNNFESYVMYHELFSKKGTLAINISDKTGPYDANKKLSEELGDEEFVNVIKTILSDFFKDNGVGFCTILHKAKSFKVQDGYLLEATITLKDIVNYYDGQIDKMPQSLKREIMNRQITSIIITMDPDKKLII